MSEISELQTYLYDLKGYLVVEDVLSADEVARLRAIVDGTDLDHLPPSHRFGSAGGSAPTGSGFLAWGAPFVGLMDHPLTMNVMRAQLGDCFRLDRIFGMHMKKGLPAGRMHSDYGASQPFSRAERGRFFTPPAHEALHGFGVAAWNLTDSGPAHGGLRVIPGSHNSHYKLPKAIRAEEYDDVIVVPQAPAGSVTFFSEALTHGTAAWRADHDRYTLLYKYCASQLTWSRTRVTAPEGVELTERQRLLLEEPAGAHWFFSSLFPEDAPGKRGEPRGQRPGTQESPKAAST